MIFEYNTEKINTMQDITISIADLRDLITARHLTDDLQAFNEYNLILSAILRKNRLEQGDIKISLKKPKNKLDI